MTTEIDPNNEVLELEAPEIWKLINRSDREIRVIGEEGGMHVPTTSFWKTEDGRDSVSIYWNENGEECGMDVNAGQPVPVEVIKENEEYIIWWYYDIPVRIKFVQPSL